MFLLSTATPPRAERAEPSLTCSTSPEICLSRRLIAKPFIGSSAKGFSLPTKIGKGEGKLVPMAKVDFDQDTGVLQIENYASEPVRLSDVQEVGSKADDIAKSGGTALGNEKAPAPQGQGTKPGGGK